MRVCPDRLQGRRTTRDRGTAIIEFAIVLPVLLALLLGVVDLGLWFNDSLSVRQGVSEAARKATVRTSFASLRDPVSGAPCSGAGLDAVACGAKALSISTGGTPYARVFVARAVDGTPVPTWDKGDYVVVCVAIRASSFTGFVPLPGGGVIESSTLMSIENTSSTPSPISYRSDSDPSGQGWAWCHA